MPSAGEGSRDRRRALVIVPTYNERETIDEVVSRLFGAVDDSVHLLVVDDGSPDGTAKRVRELAGPNPIDLLERRAKLGLGTAYIAGFERALRDGYDAVVEMDADLSHDPAMVPALLKALDEADMVIGSRYVSGGKVQNWSRARRALSLAANLYARLCLGSAIRDWTSGFRAYRASILEKTDLDDVLSEGYVFQIEMARRVLEAGGRVIEFPITFVERAGGVSKISRRVVLEAVGSVTKWGLQRRFKRPRAGQ